MQSLGSTQASTCLLTLFLSAQAFNPTKPAIARPTIPYCHTGSKNILKINSIIIDLPPHMHYIFKKSQLLYSLPMQIERQNMKVVVRVRPLNKKEDEVIQNYQAFWQGRKRGINKGKLPTNALTFFTKYHNIKPNQVMKISSNSVSVCDQEYKNTQRKMRDYCFSEVFDANYNNRDIFDKCIKVELEGIFDGINCSLLAYGITGSGKTFSVFGHPKIQRGISYLVFDYVFGRKEEIEREGGRVEIKFSFIEIYNENIRDLLSDDGKKLVTLGEDKGVVTLNDAQQISIESVDKIIQLISTGTAKRTSATTESNLISSRSHAILKLNIETIKNGQKYISKLFIIDLAGSQKLNTQSNQRRQQSSNINKSLLTLGNCINALVQNVKKPGGSHVPYRDSKLTRLLKDSLGGAARTIMISCISPHPFTLDQTITTLNYAQRAQGIKKQITKNIKLVDQSCQRCKQLQTPHKLDSDPFEEISLWNSPPLQTNNQTSGFYMDICQKLYQDIIQNARQAQQIQRLRPDIVEPCGEFNLILKDNEQQRVHLKNILFNLLNEKIKIVVKQPELKMNSARKKKIRLSSSRRKNTQRQMTQISERQVKDNIGSERTNILEVEENVVVDEGKYPFLSLQESNIKDKNKREPRIAVRDQNCQYQTVKRRRSKFQKVPRPSTAKKPHNVLTQNPMNHRAEEDET